MAILFIVDDLPDSIFARRVRNFVRGFSRLTDYKIVYRDDEAKIKNISRFIRALTSYKPKTVYLEPIAFSGCTAVLLAKIFIKFKYVFCVSDAYAELIKSNHSRTVAFFASILERLWVKSADVILTCNPLHADWLKEKIKKNNIDYLEHGVDAEIFKPSEKRELRIQLGLGDSLVVGLIGSLIWVKRYQFCYGWDLVEALKYLRDLDIKALIIGGGSGLPYLKEAVNSRNLQDKVVFTAWVAHDKVADYINCMDVCISTQSNDLVGYLRCPTKLSEYMACGKYIISTDVGYAKLYVDKVGTLLSYSGIKDESYPKRLAEHIRYLYYNRAVLEKGKIGRDILKERLENKILSKKLEDILWKI